MPRLLKDQPCEVTFDDRISETRITLFYRLPTTQERIKYSNSLVSKRRNKIETSMGEARLKYGAAILLGFKEGAFETDKGLLASDPKAPHYDPDWKNIVRKYAPDVIAILAFHVFEASLVLDESPGG